MKDITMYLRDGTADKQYRVWIAEENGLFICRVSYGRRGGHQTVQNKTGFVTQGVAEAAFDVAVKEKKSKGYQEGADGTKVIASQSRPSEFIPPMLLTDADAEAANSFITLDEYCGQMKLDGIRCQIHIHDGIRAYSRTAKPVALPAAVVSTFQHLKVPHAIFDGELVGDQFYAFDVLATRGVLVEPTSTALPYSKRLAILEHLIEEEYEGPVLRAATSYEPQQKQKMHQILYEQGAEGMVFKRLDRAYQPGVRADHAFKLKFVATATVRVHSLNERRSVNMVLGDGTTVGSVSIPPNKPVPPQDAFIEVRYLYAHRGGSLSQPVFIRVRQDVERADHEDTLQYKGEKRKRA